MKHFIAFAFAAVATPALAQVEIDQPIQLTGGTGNRAVRNLELPVNATDAASKEYVDAAVAGGGGGSNVTMISAESPTTFNYYLQGIAYCRDLVESGYSDWGYPTVEDLERIIAIGATIPNGTSSNQFLVRISQAGGNDFLARVQLSTWFIGPGNTTMSGYYARCVR